MDNIVLGPIIALYLGYASSSNTHFFLERKIQAKSFSKGPAFQTNPLNSHNLQFLLALRVELTMRVVELGQTLNVLVMKFIYILRGRIVALYNFYRCPHNQIHRHTVRHEPETVLEDATTVSNDGCDAAVLTHHLNN